MGVLIHSSHIFFFNRCRLTGLFQWSVRQSAEVENQMVSVERILDYCRLPQEPALAIAGADPPGPWPARGALSIERAVLRYRPGLPPALNGISLEVPAGSTVGHVPRLFSLFCLVVQHTHIQYNEKVSLSLGWLCSA